MRIQQGWAVGIAGGFVLSAVMAMARALGVPIHVEALWGTLIFPERTLPVVFFGMVVHLTVCAVLGTLYLWVMDAVNRGGPRVGILLAVPHAVTAGLALDWLPAVHPLVPLVFPAPGAFMTGFGVSGVAAFGLAHVAFGLVQGVCWSPRDSHVDDSTNLDGVPA